MFFTFIEVPMSAAEIARAKRRDMFASILFMRPNTELALLAERTPTLVDLELTGCENETEYRDIVRIIMNQKTADGIKASPKLSSEVRNRRAAHSLRELLALAAADKGFVDGAMRAFLSDLVKILDG